MVFTYNQTGKHLRAGAQIAKSLCNLELSHVDSILSLQLEKFVSQQFGELSHPCDTPKEVSLILIALLPFFDYDLRPTQFQLSFL